MKLKKLLIIFISSTFLFTCFSFLAYSTSNEIAYPSDTGVGNNLITSGWQAFYIPTNSMNVSDLKTDMTNTQADGWKTRIPNMTDPTHGDYNANFYLHHPQTKSGSCGNVSDIGLSFTAPKEGVYRIDFAGTSLYDGTENADGVLFSIYKNDFTVGNKLFPLTDETGLLTTTLLTKQITELSLQKDDKLLFRFNKNQTHYSDNFTINKLDVYYTLKTITFPIIEPAKAVIVTGSVFPQFFNVENKPSKISYWRPFYIDVDTVCDMRAEVTAQRKGYIIPSAGPDDVYAFIWEGVGNVTQPPKNYKIGSYFIAPSDGTVQVDYGFSYDANDSSVDGVGVEIYKNNLNTVLKSRFVVGKANNSDHILTGSITALNVTKGEKIIFLYDKNVNHYGDQLNINELKVSYTSAPAMPALINPKDNKIIVEENIIKAPTGTTISTFLEMINITDGCVLKFYNGSNTLIEDQNTLIANVGSIKISSVDTMLYSFTPQIYVPANTPATVNNPKTSEDNYKWPLLLMLSLLVVFRIKKPKTV